MKFESIGELQNQAKLVHDILSNKLGNVVNELEDGYGIPSEVVEALSMSLFVKNTQKSLWKAGRTKFVKAFEKEVVNLIDESTISFEDLGFLLYLASKYTSHEDNYLRKDDEFLTKKKLIEDIYNSKKVKESESYYKKKIRELEKKNLILSEPHPTDKRNKVFYLSPYLFYKGKFMDTKAKKALLNITKTLHNDIEKLNNEGKTNIPLDMDFKNKDDDTLINQIIEYLNEAS